MSEIVVISKTELEAIIQDNLNKALTKQKHEQNSEQDRFLSLDEAASFLQLAKQTLYGFTSQRSIPFIKRGKKLYFKQHDLERWLNEGRKLTASEIVNTKFKTN